MRISRLLLLAAAAAIVAPTVSCTRKASTTSTVTFQMPQTGFQAPKYQHVNTLLSKSALNYTPMSGDGPDWDSGSMSTISDVGCFAVMIGGNEPAMSAASCTNVNNATIMRFGRTAGLFAPGETASIEVPSGPARTIYIIGAKLVNGSCEKTFPEMTFANYTNPYVIGQLTRDLPPGNVTVDIQATADFVDAKKIGDCTFIKPGGSGPTNPNMCTWNDSDVFTANTGYNAEGSAITFAGSTIFSAGYAQAPGMGKRFIVRRSLDNGATWTMSDDYQSSTSNTVALGIRSFGSTILAFGATDVSFGNWLIRRSEDMGATWATVDSYFYSSGAHQARDGAIDPNGKIWAVGFSTSGGYRYGTLRSTVDYGTSWALEENYQEVATRSTEYHALTILPNETKLIAGTAQDGASTYNWLVRARDDMGISSTSDLYQYEAGGGASANGIASKTDGTVYAVGYARSVAAPVANHWIVRESTDWGSSWTTVDSFQMEAGYDATANGVTIDASGAVHVAGMASSSTGSYSIVRTLKAGVWATTMQHKHYGPGSQNNSAMAVAVSPSNQLFVTGFGYDNAYNNGAFTTRKMTCPAAAP